MKQDLFDRLEIIQREVRLELYDAMDSHGPMHSPHEGWAVIWEELDELWDEVRQKPSNRSIINMRKEAIQVAAMALRFIMDVCDANEENNN